MLTQISVAAPIAEQEIMTGLSAKLRQLRRLRVTSDAPLPSLHLQSALQSAQQAPARETPEVTYIFIGISLPQVVPAED